MQKLGSTLETLMELTHKIQHNLGLSVLLASFI